MAYTNESQYLNGAYGISPFKLVLSMEETHATRASLSTRMTELKGIINDFVQARIESATLSNLSTPFAPTYSFSAPEYFIYGDWDYPVPVDPPTSPEGYVWDTGNFSSPMGYGTYGEVIFNYSISGEYRYNEPFTSSNNPPEDLSKFFAWRVELNGLESLDTNNVPTGTIRVTLAVYISHVYEPPY